MIIMILNLIGESPMEILQLILALWQVETASCVTDSDCGDFSHLLLSSQNYTRTTPELHQSYTRTTLQELAMAAPTSYMLQGSNLSSIMCSLCNSYSCNFSSALRTTPATCHMHLLYLSISPISAVKCFAASILLIDQASCTAKASKLGSHEKCGRIPQKCQLAFFFSCLSFARIKTPVIKYMKSCHQNHSYS